MGSICISPNIAEEKWKRWNDILMYQFQELNPESVALTREAEFLARPFAQNPVICGTHATGISSESNECTLVEGKCEGFKFISIGTLNGASAREKRLITGYSKESKWILSTSNLKHSKEPTQRARLRKRRHACR